MSTQLQALQTLVKKGAPTQHFLWLLELASQNGLLGYGYLMRLREPQYKGILDLMKRKVEPTFKTLTTAGLQLADCYLQLHTRGFCYCDISFGNVFWNAKTGDVLICDNDNVIINGEKPEIGGTIGFMAPEVVAGTAHPSIDTDKHSLAVLLFYMFMLHHPLEGKREAKIKCFDQPAKAKLYGTEPIFIFDPNNDTNRPDDRYHQVVKNFWPIYPKFLQDLFIKAFTSGLHDSKHGRVTENEWKAAMARLRDSILYCQKCAAENFYDPETLKAAGGKMPRCWSCKTEMILPFRIGIGKNVTMLNHDSRLYPHHVDDQKLYDFSQPIAEVFRHPKAPNLWGLKNLGSEKWVVALADGSFRDVEPGRSVSLARGARINFGKVEGEIGY